MASRKDYVATANAIKNGMESGPVDPDVNCTLREVAEEMAAYYAADNPRFDVKKFYTACGLEVL